MYYIFNMGIVYDVWTETLGLNRFYFWPFMIHINKLKLYM